MQIDKKMSLTKIVYFIFCVSLLTLISIGSAVVIVVILYRLFIVN